MQMREATTVLPLTPAHARVLLREPESFRDRFGLELAPGYLAFPEALAPMLAALESGMDPRWFSHLIVDDPAATVVGLGGYTGPPQDAAVEIGYSIAPEHRGRGHATGASRIWIERARAAGVRLVRAHTLPEPNASTAVLTRCGFVRTGEVDTPDDGLVWRWELDLER